MMLGETLERQRFLGLGGRPKTTRASREQKHDAPHPQLKKLRCLSPGSDYGMKLYFKLPFPGENVFLQVMALRVPVAHDGLFYSYNLFFFTTPCIAYSILLSGLYVFDHTVHNRIRAGKLPPYPDPSKRNDLFLVVGEIRNKPSARAFKNPPLVDPPRGSTLHRHGNRWHNRYGKTNCCRCAFAEQILAFHASDKDKRSGGLVGPGSQRRLLPQGSKKSWIATGGGDEYTEIGRGSEYRDNPLHSDLDV